MGFKLNKIIIDEDDSITKTMDEYLKECPTWVIEKGTEIIKNHLSENSIEEIRLEHAADPKTWWARFHHGFGTLIRNKLRDEVCRDNELPSENWDDYYIQIIELACGIRKPIK